MLEVRDMITLSSDVRDLSQHPIVEIQSISLHPFVKVWSWLPRIERTATTQHTASSCCANPTHSSWRARCQVQVHNEHFHLLWTHTFRLLRQRRPWKDYKSLHEPRELSYLCSSVFVWVRLLKKVTKQWKSHVRVSSQPVFWICDTTKSKLVVYGGRYAL